MDFDAHAYGALKNHEICRKIVRYSQNLIGLKQNRHLHFLGEIADSEIKDEDIKELIDSCIACHGAFSDKEVEKHKKKVTEILEKYI